MTRVPMLSLLAWLIAVFLIAGIVHISAIFLLPSVAAHDSYARLASAIQGRGFQPAAALAPVQDALPFTDPATTVTVCRFDLGAAPWRIRVDTDSEALTSLSFRARNGTVFHTLTDRAALRGRLDVFLGTTAQVDAAEAGDTDDGPAREVRLVSPSQVGLVFLRTMPASSAGLDALRRRVRDAVCQPAG